MAQPGQQDRKEAGSASHVQDFQVLPVRKFSSYLPEPAVRKGAFQLSAPLLHEALTALCPVFRDPLFSVVKIPDDPSVCDHGTVFQYLQAACLVEDNAVAFRAADFRHISLIVLYRTQDLASLDHISRHLIGIPEACGGCSLVSDINHIERIIDTIIPLSLVDTQRAEDIPHIPSG